jgi:hypothetical protein
VQVSQNHVFSVLRSAVAVGARALGLLTPDLRPAPASPDAPPGLPFNCAADAVEGNVSPMAVGTLALTCVLKHLVERLCENGSDPSSLGPIIRRALFFVARRYAFGS